MEKEVREIINYVDKGIKKELTIYEDSSATLEYIDPKYNKKMVVKFPAVGTVTVEEILKPLRETYIERVMK